MELIILRHGEAGKRTSAASRDFERSLTVSGKAEVEDVAKSLDDLKLKCDVIASSPLKRAFETAEVVAKRLKKQKALEIWDELRPESDFRDLYKRLAKQKHESCIMLVGHEPYLSTMIADVIGAGKNSRIALKKAGVAKLEVTALNSSPSAELRWLLTPRLLKKVS